MQEIQTNKTNLIPILEYVWIKYLKDPKLPNSNGSQNININKHLVELQKREKNRTAMMDYLRTLSPFERHIVEAGRKVMKLNKEMQKNLSLQNPSAITKTYFDIIEVLLTLKIWQEPTIPFYLMDKKLTFTDEEKSFIDIYDGIDTPLLTNRKTIHSPQLIMGTKNIDKKELWKGSILVSADYEQAPLRNTIKEYIFNKYGIERVDNFSGTSVPIPAGHQIKNVSVAIENPDMHIFNTLSQFLEYKYDSLRRSTYRPLETERHETGGYSTQLVKFNLKDGKLAEIPNGAISANIHYFDPPTILLKMVSDVKFISQALFAGAKKIDREYFFNIFYHFQFFRKEADQEQIETVPTQKPSEQRFDPASIDDPLKHRDRINPTLVKNLVSEFMKIDLYIFGGHFDLDLYLDGIGIRRKPDIVLVEGEGLGCYDYTNNLLIIPSVCPFQLTPIDQVLAALADFRYSLWTGNPKEIFNEQGVGFIIGGKKIGAKKALWSVFPTTSTGLIKQKVFKDLYRRHILSKLFKEGITSIANIPVPKAHDIVETSLNRFFNAYIPLIDFDKQKKAEILQTSDFVPFALSDEGENIVAADFSDIDATESAETSTLESTEEEIEKIPFYAPSEEQSQKTVQQLMEQKLEKVLDAPALISSKEEYAKISKKVTQAKDAISTVKCSKCGKELPANSKFCLECGTPVEISKPLCTSCKIELPADSKFCNICGNAVGK